MAYGLLMLADVAYSITLLILDAADSVDTVTNLLENFDQLICEVKSKYDEVMRIIGARSAPINLSNAQQTTDRPSTPLI